jgi:carbamate kinase
VVLLSGKQFEVDHPKALVHREGVAIFVGPGGVPVVFDHEGVEHFFGDLAERSVS